MYIYRNTHSQPLLQNHLMDVYEICRDEVLMARTCMCLGFLSDPPWGGSKAGQERLKESFKDKRLYLALTKSSFRLNVHSNILMYC